jgi:hypothetical protein
MSYFTAALHALDNRVFSNFLSVITEYGRYRRAGFLYFAAREKMRENLPIKCMYYTREIRQGIQQVA